MREYLMHGHPRDGLTSYQVLARKYRPQSFADLIGQEPMVRTLTNAFSTGRIAHAFMLTGVRGVGKTTTARLIARALNWSGRDGSEGPRIDLAEPGIHCEAIAQSRHQDVMEMDAASRTGIGDIREIIESVRYAPALARYKVYIIDEVHMLSTQAFNGLLKTLEEPPPHVKFIFATTEIRKVPVTVLSRCQRFDLRRVESDRLIAHLNDICARENVSAQRIALTLLARAAQGSVRDALSLLDQAIAHAGSSGITGDSVRDMLGLADGSRILVLFEQLMSGRIGEALAELQALYEWGADPLAVLQDLADLVHWITRLKIVGEAAEDIGLADAAKTKAQALARELGMPVLARAWQMLLKGITEVQNAARPLQATEMLLIRLAYVSDMPAPAELVARLETRGPEDERARGELASRPARAPLSSSGGHAPSAANPATMAAARGPQINSVDRAASAPSRTGAMPLRQPLPAKALAASAPENFEALVKLAGTRDIGLRAKLEIYVRLIRYEPGLMEFAPAPGAPANLAQELRLACEAWTGRPWQIRQTLGPARPTLREQEDDRQARLRREAAGTPLVAAALQTFPGAEIVAVRKIFSPEALAPPPAPDEESFIQDSMADEGSD
jgi:DNA polymerase-3 subunit gamma/tau